MKKQLLISAILFLGLLSPANAESLFFKAMPDMPLMAGLEAMPDMAVHFDKAQGRIIEAVARIDTPTRDEIADFYAKILPQFGWRQSSANTYIRQNEQLQLHFELFEGQEYLCVMLMPVS